MNTKHLTYLDSLRGLAALTVAIFHFITMYWQIGGVFARFEHASRLAVCLFFILSGFVLSRRFLGVDNMKWPVIEAIIKRPFRLLGVVWVTVILGLLVDMIVYGVPLSQFTKDWGQFTVDFFVSPFEAGFKYNPPLWTIAWEVWGSMLVFGTVFCCGTLPKYFRLMIFSGLIILNIHNFYCAFIIGMLIADLHKNFHAAALVKYRNLLSTPMLIAGIVAGTMIHAGGSDAVMSACIEDGFRMIAAIAIFVAVMLDTAFIRSILECKPVNFLGNISYSFYAIHFLIMKTISETVDAILNQYLQRDVAFFSMVLITLPIIIFAAWIMDKYVDKPSMRLAARLAGRAVSVITLEVAMRGSRLKLIVMFRIPLTPLRILFSSKRRYASLINGAMQLCMVRR